MINDLRKQTPGTVLKFLQRLGNSPQMYVKHTVGIRPLIQDRDVYLFANDEEIVIVLLDPAKGKSYELADETSSDGDQPYYFSEFGHRVSPAWQLAVTCELLRHRLRRLGRRIPEVRGALLVCSDLMNYQDLMPVWESLGVIVFHKMSRRMRLDVADNTDEDHLLSFPINFFYEADMPEGDIRSAEDRLRQLMYVCNENLEEEEAASDDDDLLADFDMDAFEKWASGEAFSADSEEDSEGEETSEDGEESEDDEDSDDGMEGFQFSSGLVQQSQNVQVKVQVLSPLWNPREKLDKLVGCTDIKKRMDELVKMTRYNSLIRAYNPNGKQHKLSLHSVFFGRPGTGKSTVARILGSLLKEAGVLSKGHVVVCNRGTFVGTNWGDEERSVNQVLEMAEGGVLMIDEAYLLATAHPSDPGKLVIQLLMDLLADENRRDVAVVLCGYKDEMGNLIRLNPGIDSRFPNRFEFRDFSLEELHEITRRRIREYGYHFTRAAWVKFKRVLEDAYNHRDKRTWGNARFVANLLERIYCRHASRCVELQRVDKEHLLTITPADIEKPEQAELSVKQPLAAPSEVRVTGFGK